MSKADIPLDVIADTLKAHQDALESTGEMLKILRGICEYLDGRLNALENKDIESKDGQTSGTTKQEQAPSDT